ncbi:MAG TPA: hypothetical protein VGK94_01900 [Candidatus Polarisedimenticolia bacterium]|jgi:hypothetical protein
MRDLHFDLHGLSVSIRVEDHDLRDFIKEHFQTEKGANPEAELSIKAVWRWGARAPVAPPGPGKGPAVIERLGRGVSLARGRDEAGGGDGLRAVWTKVPDFPELTLAFEMEGGPGGRLKVEADCAYQPKGMARRIEYLRPSRADKKRNRLFFKLMYFMVYYPMAWTFERTRGWGLLHASAVAMPSGQAIILSGLGGVGKSTLGLSLLARPGVRFLSDNLIFHDEERIYACPEPVRLDAAAVAGMAEGGMEPERTKLPASAHPKPTYRVVAARRADAAAPGAIYFLRFAQRSGVTRIDARRAAAILAAGNDLAREIKDYRPTSALLSILAAERDRPDPAGRSNLARLLAPARCAIFRIGEREKITDTAARLADELEEAR